MERASLRVFFRAVRCRLGFHRWQYLMAPPTWRKGDEYESGIWCIFCRAKWPREPGIL